MCMYNINKIYKKGFIINEDWLRKIDQVAKGFINKKSEITNSAYQLVFSDGLSYETLNLEEIFQEDNTKNARFTSIRLRYSGDEYYFRSVERIEIKISRSYKPEIAIDACSSDQDLIRSTTSTLGSKVSMKEPDLISRFINTNLFESLLIMVIAISLISLVSLATNILDYNNYAVLSVVYFLFGLSAVFIAFPVVRFLQKLYPISIFQLGEESNEYIQSLEWRDKIFFSILICGVLLPLITTLISSRIT